MNPANPAIILPALGVLLIVAGIWQTVDKRRWRRYGIHTTARIVRLRKVISDDGGSYTCLISYTDQHGTEQLVDLEDVDFSFARRHRDGDDMDIVIDPDDPRHILRDHRHSPSGLRHDDDSRSIAPRRHPPLHAVRNMHVRTTLHPVE